MSELRPSTEAGRLLLRTVREPDAADADYRKTWDEWIIAIEREAVAAFVWGRLESTPGFNEELAQGLADVKAGRVTAWADVKRRLDEEGYESPAIEAEVGAERDRLEAALRPVIERHSTDDVPQCQDGTHHVLELARNVIEARPAEGMCSHCGQFAPCTERRIAAAFVEVMDVARAALRGSEGTPDRELLAMSLTGEQVAELVEQVRGMVDPITGELHVEFVDDRLLGGSEGTPDHE